MVDFYIKKMIESHNKGMWLDRANYALMAKVDFVKWFYLDEGANV
ncbi:hypothetical protein NVP1029O_81 [Vibrio phage 1.029.O._10N.261.55.A7]|nr:hypothetical protein NVP1029O_81 [Vibrio phage 1.029.O._10N.261.55.A7]